ncbi:solute carrier family 28 member 3-like isoform X2 [Littorina saxatilis]|uniref:solute carrier family 28 member 3-like isoform X2 n=1 Tax=Littorina saxatilis TaxID=31220 RepID=UPI0038B4537C
MSAKRETDNVELTHVVMTISDSTPGRISDEDNCAAHRPDQSNCQHSQHQDHPHHRIATDNIHGAEDGCENEIKHEHAQLFGATPNEETDGHSSGTDRGLLVRRLIYIVLICAYFVYLTLALTWNLYQAVPVLCITLLVVSHFTWRHLSSTDVIQDIRHKITNCAQTAALGCLGRRVIRLSCYGVAAAAMLIYSVVINIRSPENLISLAGVVTLLLFSWLISHDRTKICLRPVVWGLGAQLCLGVLVLKTTTGGAVLRWLGHQVELFLNNVTAGVSFVFGEKYEDFLFAFKLMPTVLFVSSVMSVLYYIGVMHVIINTFAVVLRVSMGTTAPETISTAASIFLGQPEASFSIRPYLKTMTNSELHAIMTAGFASVSVDLFGLFVNYGISSAHILTAVLMSAPAGLAVSKIVYPQSRSTVSSEEAKEEEEEKDELKGKEDGPQNVIDAAARGAQDAVPIVLAVGATLIAFLSILQFLNAALTYLGSLVHIENLTMEASAQNTNTITSCESWYCQSYLR